jgi:HdeA/HdeB family
MQHQEAMMTSPRKASPILSATLVTIAFIGLARAEDDVETRIQIDEITCREALKMSGDERTFTAVFFHGFVSGKKNETLFDAPALSEATDKIADFCIDNPSEPLLKAFETIRK